MEHDWGEPKEIPTRNWDWIKRYVCKNCRTVKHELKIKEILKHDTVVVIYGAKDGNPDSDQYIEPPCKT